MENLKLAQPKQFILAMHIFPGLNDYNGVQEFWHANYTNQLLQIIEEYQDNIQLVSGAHIHRSQVRNPSSSSYQNISVPLLVTTSITPIYFNNPGYTTLEISLDKRVNKTNHLEFSKLLVHTFQLQYYLLTGTKAWHDLDPKEQYGLDLNDKSTLRNYKSFVENSMDLGAFDGFATGMDTYTREALYGFIFYPLYVDADHENDLPLYMCSLLWYENGDDFKECMN